MIDEHLQECAECHQRLTKIDTSIVASVDSSKPLIALKKEIRKRRWFAAIVAAMLVFVAVYTHFYHENKMGLIPWQNGLIKVEGVETRPYSEVFGGEASSDPSESTIDVLVLKYNGIINGIQESRFKDDDGTVTGILLCWSSQRGSTNLIKSYDEMTLYPVPDRLLYGFGSQQLLWGDSINGGVEVLPRLALAFYICVAVGLALITGAVWFFLRHWGNSWIPRQIFFAPVSWLIAHFLIKGTGTETFFMERELEREFISIMLITISVYVLLSLVWQIWLQHKKGI